MSTIGALDAAALPSARAARADRTIAEARALHEHGSRGHDRAQIREAAEAFESLLVRQLVTRMREAQIEGGLFGEGPGAGVYEGMFDEFMSNHLATHSPLGIADMLERQWTANLDGVAGPQPPAARAEALSAAQRFRALRGYGRATHGSDPDPAVSREFGWDRHPILDRRSHHDGVDWAVPTGTPVRAPRAGRVTRVDATDGGYGLQVLVEHPGGLRTRYAHLSAASVRPGQLVAPGDQLGRVGESGRVTGPHLHFETLLDGKPADPRELLGDRVAAQVLGLDADESGER